MTTRILLSDFSLANPLYEGATVQVYTVDPSTHARTTTLAPLYTDLTSITQGANPQTLDSEGKWLSPIYIDQAVVMVVSGPQFPTHETGIEANEIGALNDLRPTTIEMGPSWLDGIWPGALAAIESSGGLASTSPAGSAAGLFAIRSLDLNYVSYQNFGLGVLAVNDNASHIGTIYGGYIEYRRKPGAGITQGLEITGVNHGDVHNAQPYFAGETGSTLALWLGAGRSDVAGNHDVTLALGIVGGAGVARFMKGIVFGADSLVPVADLGGIAISLPAQYCMAWYAPNTNDGAGSPAAYISSAISDTSGFTHQPRAVFVGTGLQIDTANTTTAAAFQNGLNTFQSTRINGNLEVTGSATLDGPLTCSGLELLLGTLGVSGNAAFSGSLGIFGSLDVNGPMTMDAIHLAGYADDTAAATAGIAIRGVYLNSTTKALTVRVA